MIDIEDKAHLFKDPDKMVLVTNFVIVYEDKPYDLYMTVTIKKKTTTCYYIFKDEKFLRIVKYKFHRILQIKDAMKEFPQYFI